jgi:hypothetical protein
MDFHLDALLNLPNVTVFTYYQKEGYKKPAQICPAFAAVRAIHSIFLVRCQKISRRHIKLGNYTDQF